MIAYLSVKDQQRHVVEAAHAKCSLNGQNLDQIESIRSSAFSAIEDAEREIKILEGQVQDDITRLRQAHQKLAEQEIKVRADTEEASNRKALLDRECEACGKHLASTQAQLDSLTAGDVVGSAMSSLSRKSKQLQREIAKLHAVRNKLVKAARKRDAAARRY